MDRVWLVTSVSAVRGHRCWGWFLTKERAIEAVEGNYGDINECGHYEYAVIESAAEGILGILNGEEVWLEWREGRYVQCDKPADFHNVVNFGMG